MLASQERRKATTAIPEVVMVQILCKVEDVSNDQLGDSFGSWAALVMVMAILTWAKNATWIDLLRLILGANFVTLKWYEDLCKYHAASAIFIKLGVFGPFCPWTPSARWARISSGAFGQNACRVFAPIQKGWMEQRRKNPYSALALLSGKFLRIW